MNLINQLTNVNPNLLLNRKLSNELFHFYINYFENIIMDRLSSQNSGYIYSISEYAIKLYACKLGAECGENSSVVFMECYSNSNFCGVTSYTNFIDTKLTDAQQYDIKIYVEFLEDLFAEKIH